MTTARPSWYTKAMIRVEVPAKVNLSLLIKGQENGYHRLDSVVASAAIYDVVTVEKAEHDEIVGSAYPFVLDKVQGLVKAARATFGFGGVCIRIDSGVPLGAGLGGSSVACAGVIRALDELFELRLPQAQCDELADSTGSDTRFLLAGGCGRIVGRSEVKQRFRMPSVSAMIAVKGVSETPKAFARYDEEPVSYEGDNVALIALLEQGSFDCASSLFVNDLTPAARALQPAVKDGLSLNRRAFMTGSGSGLVIPFPTPDEVNLYEANGYTVWETQLGDFSVVVKRV